MSKVDSKLNLLPRNKVYDNRNWEWRLCGYVFHSKKLNVKLQSGSDIKEVGIHQIRLDNGSVLTPGYEYKLSLGNTESRFALILEQVGEYRTKEIHIFGNPNCSRIVQKIPIKCVDIKIACCTNKPFDEPPETVKIRVGDTVQMRKDWASDYYWGSIQYEGQNGIVTSIKRGARILDSTSTLKIDFEGVSKNYSIHRITDKNGASLCLGWHYNITRKGDTFEAKPSRAIEQNRTSWSDSTMV